MSVSPYPPVTRNADTQAFVIAIVQALLAEPGVTGDQSVNGYEGTGQRVYPEANLDADATGKGQQFPYLIVTNPANTVPLDYSGAYLDALFDCTAVDRGHTTTNIRGGTQNVVGIAAAAYARLLTPPLNVTGYGSVQVRPAIAPRGTAIVQSGVVIRQRLFSVRITAIKL